MSLTDLQKERVTYHLDFVASNFILKVDKTIAIITLNDSQKLALVGQELNELTSDEAFYFEGSFLCSNSSLLGKVERAYAKLDPDIIDNSLFVESAGSVTLRGTELRKREELYRNLVSKMAQLIGANNPSLNRVGFQI